MSTHDGQPTMHPHARQRAVHPASLSIDQLLKDCHVTRTRRSGPGGQHRNKVETAVVIVHRPTGVRAEASERRSQAENHSEAVFRLRVNLALQVRSISSPETEPSRLWQSRCRGSRVAVNSGHDAYPAILAEALDVVAACGMDIKTAAGSLGCTASQLVKLLQSETRAIAIVNLERQSLGLAKLR